MSAPLFAMRSSPGRSRLRRLRALWIAALSACVGLLAAAGPAGAVNSVVTANGATWQVHDAAQPGLDTGSLRTVSNSGVQGFGNIIVDVSTDPRMDGQMMRGFGLRFDGLDRFKTTQAVDLGGISITRSLRINRAGNWGRFFDTFTNTTGAPIVVKVSFGGALGYNSGTNQSFVAASSSGDTFITQDDSWTIVRTGANNQRPVGVVTGSPDLGLAGMGNHELDPFTDPLPTTGMAANFYGYVSQFTVEPGKTKSLARFVVIGPTGADATADTQEAVEDLAEDPDFSDLSTAEICSLVNWDLTELDAVDPDDCDAVKPLDVPPAPSDEAPKTASAYDVVGKTIAELQADMEAGVTTSEEITRAYLDRIRVYDTGQFGFHAYITVAEDAIAQARAADQARREGAKGELLGIPIAIKDLYDTKDMPTTDGTLALEGWQPKRDAYQVELLREAGAVIIGKTNLSQFANSGSYSESGWGQVWNGLYPSKTSFGSSGGSAVAVATSMAAAAMGTQTGVSLYAPSTGASLATFRGTDGMASTRGVMPLTWGQDYAGPIARTVTDLAYLLNATTGTDPEDTLLTGEADERRPEDWTDYLDEDALEGKRIGYIPSSFVSSYADDGTGEAVMSHFADLEAAGAELVEVPSLPSCGPSPGGSRNIEGWARYIELHDDFPFENGNQVLASERNLPYNRGNPNANTPRMTPEQVEAWLEYRRNCKAIVGEYMDQHGIDALVYAGFISDMYSNDSASNQHSSDRGTGVPTSNVGLPTVVVPVGTNPHGYSISMQLVGRAWDDAQILAMGYALEQQAQGQQHTAYAPPLEYDPQLDPSPIEVEVPSDPVTEPLYVEVAAQAKLKGGKAIVRFANKGETRVVGKLTLRAKVKGKRRALGSAKINVGPRKTVQVRIALKPGVRKALRKRKKIAVTAVYDLRSPKTGARIKGTPRAAFGADAELLRRMPG